MTREPTARKRTARSATRDPMPWPITPMLAKLVSTLPADDERWAYEIKWDGIRGITRVDGGELQVLTRNQIDVTARYPEFKPLSRALARHTVVLDGEIIGFDAAGRATFEALQQRMGLLSDRRVEERRDVVVAYMVFDILYLDGRSLLASTYEERRAALEGLGLDGEHWHTPAWSRGGGEEMLRTSREQLMEGIIAKRLGSRYALGKRTGDWLKIKNQMRQEFVIAGWVPGAGAREGQIGALLLGHWDGDNLAYAGKVGTGFTALRLRELADLLGPLRRETSPFAAAKVAREARFVEPELVCEVEFTEWTGTGQLRHPSFKGLRVDKSSREVVREG